MCIRDRAFADDEEHFILDVVRQGYATQLQAAHPSGYVRVLQDVYKRQVYGEKGIEDLSYSPYAVRHVHCLLYTSQQPDATPKKVAIELVRDDRPQFANLQSSDGATSAVVSPDGKQIAFTETPHLKTMGGRHISYDEYMTYIEQDCRF